jgi:GSH-dependent disulfide-bond oxidoreductase
VGRYRRLQWMMSQMFGQYNHFANYVVEKIPYAIARYTNEVQRLHRGLDKPRRPGWPATNTRWPTSSTSRGNPDQRNINLANYPNVKRWHDATEARPAAQRGCAVLAQKQRKATMFDAEREVMFGKTRFAER